MKAQWIKIKTFPWRHCMIALVLMALPAVVQAQFTVTTNNGAITIVGYTGTGGAVVIPNTTNGYTVNGIGEYAFAYCTTMTSVTIPSSITSIGLDAFLGCASLTNFAVDAGNPSYTSITNALYDAARDTLIACPEGLTRSAYVIPPIVTTIGPEAFFGCNGLTNIVIQGGDRGVTSIGELAFYQCTALRSVNIPTTVTNIGVEAFAYCTGIISMGNRAANIGVFAFAYCTNLTSAYFESNAPPDAGNVFYGDPATVYYIPGTTGWGATFGGAPTVADTPPSELNYSTSYYNGSGATITEYRGTNDVVVIPGYINGYIVTSIGGSPNGFQNPFVTSVIIPNTVTNIGDDTFFGCDGLTNIVIPDSVTSIGLEAFNCMALTSVTIPGSVTNIGDVAFECRNLKSAYFEGNAPPDVGANVFFGDPAAVVYYLPGTTGWGKTFGGAPTELWLPAVSSFEPSFRAQNQQFGFLISWAPNTSVTVQACTNLANPNWIPVATCALNNGTNYFSDAQWTNYPNRYYRVSGQ